MKTRLIKIQRSYWLIPLLWLCLSLAQTANAAGPAQTVPPTPRTPSTPVRAPAAPAGWSAPRPQVGALALQKPLKAIVFVGPIDGDNGPATRAAIQDARETAAALRAYGVTVQEFYPNQPDGTWANIKTAATGAHFLIYRGHGVYWSDMPYPIVGGFALKDTFVSNDMIRAELHPAENFIVMIYGCFSAGSSGNDPISVTLEEARRRVEMYSDPFFDIGAGGYYADWYGEAFTSYVHSLFQGGTQREAYEGFFDYNSSKMWRDFHRDHPAQALWLGWDNWYPPEPNWNNAFVGDPGATLADLFEDTTMLLSTTQVTYLAEPDFPVRAFAVRIESNTSDSFTWTATLSSPPAWLSISSPAQGNSGDTLMLQLDPSRAGLADEIATLHISTGTPDVQQPDQDITVRLLIADEVRSAYLPLVDSR